MVKQLLLTLGLVALGLFSFAQNLIPNPSFEQVICPISYTGFPNQIDQQVSPWRSGNCASPDIYAACSDDSITRPPAAWYGTQMPRTGQNFAAIGFYNIGAIPWYEYLVSPLTSPLVTGQRYTCTIWVSKAEQARYTTADFGFAFAQTLDTCLMGFEGPVLPYVPVVKATQIIMDTLGWVKIQGDFVAKGGEQYMLIGCFTPWENLTFTDKGNGQGRCYFYIDDVSVAPSLTSALNGQEQLLPVFWQTTVQGWKVDFPVSSENTHLRISDLGGREFLHQDIPPGQSSATLDVRQLPTGMWMWEISQGKHRAFGKRW